MATSFPSIQNIIDLSLAVEEAKRRKSKMAARPDLARKLTPLEKKAIESTLSAGQLAQDIAGTIAKPFVSEEEYEQNFGRSEQKPATAPAPQPTLEQLQTPPTAPARTPIGARRGADGKIVFTNQDAEPGVYESAISEMRAAIPPSAMPVMRDEGLTRREDASGGVRLSAPELPGYRHGWDPPKSIYEAAQRRMAVAPTAEGTVSQPTSLDPGSVGWEQEMQRLQDVIAQKQLEAQVQAPPAIYGPETSKVQEFADLYSSTLGRQITDQLARGLTAATELLAKGSQEEKLAAAQRLQAMGINPELLVGKTPEEVRRLPEVQDALVALVNQQALKEAMGFFNPNAFATQLIPQQQR